MDEHCFTPYFTKLLAATPRVNALGKDHPLATRMWMAIHRMQEQDRNAEPYITEIRAG